MSHPDPDRLGPALRDALATDQASLAPPPLQGVLDRSRRRRGMRAVGGAAVAMVILSGSAVAVVTLASRGDSDAVQFAVPSPPADSQTLAVLDSGVNPSGPWTLVANLKDGACLTYRDTYRESGACQLTDPARLDESTLLPVIDDGEALTVVAGPVPTGATRVAVTTTDGPTTSASIVQLGARTFFHTRIPPATGVRLISAETDDGRALASATDFPPPASDPVTPPSPAASPVTVPEANAAPKATTTDLELAASLRTFASQPGPGTAQSVPFGNAVRLALGADIVRTVLAQDLVQQRTWSLPGPYAASPGPFSALDLLRDKRPYEVGVGPHPHCASPPRAAPAGLETARRVWIQPADPTSCLNWYTVDVFLRDDAIVAVSLDLWEP